MTRATRSKNPYQHDDNEEVRKSNRNKKMRIEDSDEEKLEQE